MVKSRLSRRDFLKGAATGTAVVAGMGVLHACAPKTVEAPQAGNNAAAETTSAPVTIAATYDTDVVIVGSGAAGLMAGLNLARAGRKVILVEKGPTPAISNFANCGGPTATETTMQAAENATVTVNQMFNHMYEYSRTAVNAALLRNCVINSGKAVNDMLELGIPMVLMPDTYGVGFRGRHLFQAGGMDRVQPILDEITSKGGELLTNTAGTQVIMANGKAAGIYAAGETGTIQINAKAVLVCTGGFQGSQEKIEKYLGVKNCVSLGNNLSTGDGIDMVLAAGGVLDRNFCVLGNEGSGTNHKVPGRIFDFSTWNIANENLAFGIYGGLLVNPQGERFMNEQKIADYPLALGGEAYLRAGRGYIVVDEAYYNGCATVGIYEHLGKPAEWVSGPALWFPVLAKAREQLDTAISEGWAFKGETLAECAEHFGLANLETTVAEYNEMCKAGEDNQFGKSPIFLKEIGEGPYYIFEYEPAAWSTNGGIKIDHHCRALDINSNPIDGLFVAGVDNGSVYVAPYYNNEGASVGMALGSGVLAGNEIDAFLG